MRLLSIFTFVALLTSTTAQEQLEIGVSSLSDAEVNLKLVARTQAFTAKTSHEYDRYDSAVNSPKSIIFSQDGMKYYVNSLEGFTTVVFDTKTHEKLSEISHQFDESNQHLFKQNEFTIFDYAQKEGKENYNIFGGKPVESCLSHNGKYLWVTYYRRSWDANAQYPSALAIIDTETDKIIRVMPTGPLPKMIASSEDNRFVCVTHWGDNTVAIIDIQGENPMDFKYVKHLEVGRRIQLSYDESVHVDRDNDCGSCLRGTVFTPDSKYLLVAKMGGVGGIQVFETSTWKSMGTVYGMKSNVRHLAIANNQLFLSSNRLGYVQRTDINKLLNALKSKQGGDLKYEQWKSAFVGIGARTISVTKDGKYVFAAVNNEKKIVVVRSADMKVINSIAADPYPVGMALSKYETRLVVTAQGKSNRGGNSVMIYSIDYKEKP